MFEINLQLFGGRGGGSGGGGGRMPSITGSQKQVVWAEEIRSRYAREFNVFQDAVKKVNSGHGDESTNSSAYGASYGARYKGVVNTLAPRMRRLMTGRASDLNEAIKQIRNSFKSQTDARFWIDRR